MKRSWEEGDTLPIDTGEARRQAAEEAERNLRSGDRRFRSARPASGRGPHEASVNREEAQEASRYSRMGRKLEKPKAAYYAAASDTKNAALAERKKKSCVGGFFKLLLFAMLVLVAVGGVYLFLWDREKRNLPVVDAEDGNTLAPIRDEVLFLLAGVDDTGKDTPQRTDTLMLFDVNFRNGTVEGLSLPRDTRVYVGDKKTKINAAHAYGGIELTMETIRRFLGVDLDYYIKMDFETVKALVDAMGGVKFDVPATAKPVPGEVHRIGEHVLDGEEALSFLRHRQGYPNGDIDRVAAQQAFLMQMMRQLLSPWNAWRMPAILHAFRTHAETNLPALPMIPYLPTGLSIARNGLVMNTLPGSGQYIDGISYYIADSEGALALANRLFGTFMR